MLTPDPTGDGTRGKTTEVLRAIRRIIRAIDRHSQDLASRFGLTGPQLTVLMEIHADNGATTGSLARAAHLSQATVTGILDRLERAGLVCRKRSQQDRRRVLVWLSDRGREVLHKAPPPLQENFTRQFVHLADWEQSQILSSLQRVVAMMEADNIDAGAILTTGPVGASPEGTRVFHEDPPPHDSQPDRRTANGAAPGDEPLPAT